MNKVFALLNEMVKEGAKEFEDFLLRSNLEDLWKRFKGDFRLG
jgi:hypothetical protein